MDVDPGWTAQGQWQYGVPLGQQGDPSSGHTGSHVYGYNLAGTYPPSLPETHLTTAAIDCSNLSEVQLKFRRWLCIEPSYWDHAYVRVSNDGFNWMTIWQNPTSTIVDQQWVEQEFDISAVAAGQSTVYVRWTMGATDSVVQYCGWNIDGAEIQTQLPPPAAPRTRVRRRPVLQRREAPAGVCLRPVAATTASHRRQLRRVSVPASTR